jgi:hypothetical protein
MVVFCSFSFSLDGEQDVFDLLILERICFKIIFNVINELDSQSVSWSVRARSVVRGGQGREATYTLQSWIILK